MNWKPAPGALRVAVWADPGASSDKIVATMRALQACGFDFTGIGLNNTVNGQLTPANFDVLLLPGGQEDSASAYSDSYASESLRESVKAFVKAGGGLVALECGAQYAIDDLALYEGDYTTDGKVGKSTITIIDPTFGSGDQELYRTAGGGYISLADGATEVSKDASGNAVIVRASCGEGRIVLCTLDPELRGDSELDWTIWDNWAMGGKQTNSIGGWALLGRMVNWAATGKAEKPTVTEYANPSGARVAILSTNTSDGGAAPSTLSQISRAVEYSGYVPLAIRTDDINAGKLTLPKFKVLIIPGGYSDAYKIELGTSGGARILNFAKLGGGVMGICAGSYYLSKTITWEGVTESCLGLFAGKDTGAIDSIAAWPAGVLATTLIDDPVLGMANVRQPQWYQGGGYKTGLEASDAAVVATYDHEGEHSGAPCAIRFRYGRGYALLTGLHPEVRSGSDLDWTSWDDCSYFGEKLVNPDNPWTFFKAALDNWLTK